MCSLPTWEQICTFDSLFMLFGCPAGLECLCGQIKQDSPCSVVPCSWQDSQPHMPSRCIGTGGSWCGRKKAPDFSPVLAQAGSASGRGFPSTGVSSVNGLSQDAKFGPEIVLLFCCCPTALSSAYLYLAQFSHLIHHFKSHTWFRNLETSRGHFLFFSRSHTPPTAALHFPLQSQQVTAPLTMFSFF